jgi:hypothetical protein
MEVAMNLGNETALKIEVVLHRSPEQLAKLRSQLPALEASVTAAAEHVADLTLDNYREAKDRAVEYFLQGAIMQPLDIRKARMMADAMRLIFAGTEWLTAEQIGTSSTFGAAPGSRDPLRAGAARANRWKNENRIFAIQRDGKDWYPRYQFDESFTPLPIMKTIILEFGDAPRIEIAGWMESPNNYLDGKRPREVVRDAPGLVVEALGYHFARPVGTLSPA